VVVVETAAKPLRFTTAHFFDRSTSKSAPRPSVFSTFDFETSFDNYTTLISIHYTTPHYTTPNHTIPATTTFTTTTTLLYTTLHYTKPHYTNYYICSYNYVTLHCTRLHYTTLHYITLHSLHNHKCSCPVGGINWHDQIRPRAFKHGHKQ